MLYDSEAVGEALQSRAAISRGLTLKNEDRKTSTLPADSGGDAAGRWNRRGPFLLIVAITLLTFSRAFTADFVMWDDDMLIYRNRTLLPPTLHSLRVWWTSADMRMWNPLTETWRGLLALATTSTVDPITRTQLNPYIFHANNVLLHVLTTLMVYRVLLLLRLDRWPACCGALLFGLHPVQVEPVAWATALKDILCGFLSVAAIWALLRRWIFGRRPAERVGGGTVEIECAVRACQRPLCASNPFEANRSDLAADRVAADMAAPVADSQKNMVADGRLDRTGDAHDDRDQASAIGSNGAPPRGLLATPVYRGGYAGILSL